MKGKLIIISGPSGVGKTTLRKEAIKDIPNLSYSVSATTRKPRNDEENGIDYYFLTEKEFKENIEKNNFLEYEEVYNGLYYGTLKNIVDEKLKNGINVILEIDVNGALNIKKNQECTLIFVAPPSKESLEKRLIARNSDNEEKLRERLAKAEYELSFQNKYDYIVINNDLEQAKKDLKEVITNIIK